MTVLFAQVNEVAFGGLLFWSPSRVTAIRVEREFCMI